MAHTKTRASRATSLLIEPTGWVVVDGRRIKLPPMSFALIKALADRPGSGFPSVDLPELAWPGFHLVQKDVHWHIWQTRTLIGDLERANEDRLISNRPHFGYFVNLPASAIRIQEAESPAVQQVIVLADAESDEFEIVPAEPSTPPEVDERPVPLHAADPVEAKAHEVRDVPSETPPDERPVPLHEVEDTRPSPSSGEVISPSPARTRLRSALIAAGIALGIIVLVTVTVRSSAEPTAPAANEDRAQPPVTQPLPDDSRERTDGPAKRRSESPRQRAGRETGSASGSPTQQIVTATVPDTAAAPAPAPAEPDQPSDKEPVAALPPAPTNHLFHLRNPDTGDNFVTTDPNAASDYEGRGYVGGVIGRVYARSEDGTKPISTNGGIAYIFTTSQAKTDPAVRLIPLFYAAKDGDFFYTTDRAQASVGGWTASLVGYVGVP